MFDVMKKPNRQESGTWTVKKGTTGDRGATEGSAKMIDAVVKNKGNCNWQKQPKAHVKVEGLFLLSLFLVCLHCRIRRSGLTV